VGTPETLSRPSEEHRRGAGLMERAAQLFWSGRRGAKKTAPGHLCLRRSAFSGVGGLFLPHFLKLCFCFGRRRRGAEEEVRRTSRKLPPPTAPDLSLLPAPQGELSGGRFLAGLAPTDRPRCAGAGCMSSATSPSPYSLDCALHHRCGPAGVCAPH